MKVAILEFICGSGNLCVQENAAAGHPWTSLLCEGHAMLSALARDMLDAGIDVHCLLEPSIAAWGQWRAWTNARWSWSPIPFQPDRSIDGVADHWIRSARDCDAAIVIAPELDGALARMVARLREAGVVVLSGDEPFLSATCDQWQTCQAWKAHQVRYPTTWLLSDAEQGWRASESEHGWVIKRRDSAGCVGQRRIAEAAQVAREASRWCDRGPADRWIVQPWIAGQAASLAVLVADEIRVLGAFRQRFETLLEDGQTLCGYAGGEGPIPGVPIARLQRFARDVLQAIPGQPHGWVGIDFIIEPDGKWCAIEVNPRLTTSYLGYRKWYGYSLASYWARGDFPPMEFEDFPRVSFSVESFER